MRTASVYAARAVALTLVIALASSLPTNAFAQAQAKKILFLAGPRDHGAPAWDVLRWMWFGRIDTVDLLG